MHSSRSSTNSVVTRLWSHRKIVVWFPVSTRDNSVLNLLHIVSYRVPGTSSLGIKRPEREADHHLVPRVQREHTIQPMFSALPRRGAWVCKWISYFNNQGAYLESDSLSVDQEIPHILWNTRVHFHFHKIPQFSTILFLINPFHAILYYLFKVHFNIILRICLCLQSGLSSFGFYHQNSVCISPISHACNAIRQSNPPSFNN